MHSNNQPRGYSSTGFIALIDGRKMEFATYDEYREYVRDETHDKAEAA